MKTSFGKLVEELRAKGVLDEEALAGLKSNLHIPYFFIYFVLWLVIASVMLYEGKPWWAHLSLALFGVLLYWLTVRMEIRKYVIPYSRGEKIIGKVVKAGLASSYSGFYWYIKYEFDYGGKKYKGRNTFAGKKFINNKVPNIGDDIYTYMDVNTDVHTAFIPKFYEKYNLKKINN